MIRIILHCINGDTNLRSIVCDAAHISMFEDGAWNRVCHIAIHMGGMVGDKKSGEETFSAFVEYGILRGSCSEV